MTKVNYIIQLNSVLERVNNDHRIKQGHICLYMAFFQKWNREFFKKKISINREMIMEKAKFKSKTTYHNYIRDLNDWGYLKYYPSYNPARGSEVEMFVFYTQASQKLANIVPEPGQYLVPFINRRYMKCSVQRVLHFRLHKEQNFCFPYYLYSPNIAE